MAAAMLGRFFFAGGNSLPIYLPLCKDNLCH